MKIKGFFGAAVVGLLFICGLPLGGVALAQQPMVVKAAGHVTRIILLGTGGGPLLRKYRSQPASLLVVDGRPYLIDAGDGVVRQIALAGFTPQQLQTIFITHYHFDHTAGLEPLMSFIWVGRSLHEKPLPPVQIYGPPATDFLVHAALNYLSLSERIFMQQFHKRPAVEEFEAHDAIAPGVIYRDDRIRVTAVENTHYHFKPGSTEADRDKSYSYRFDTPAGSVVFTGDTGPCEALVKMAEGADVLVSEVVNLQAIDAQMSKSMSLSPQVIEAAKFHMAQEHLVPEEIGKMAARAHVRVVLLTHIVPGNDSETDTSPYTAGVEKYFSGAVIPGRDMLEYDLSKK